MDTGETIEVTRKMDGNIDIGVAVAVVILLALPLFIDVNSFRPKIDSEIKQRI